MVFLESFKMSSSKVHQAPTPPTVEQILEDLSAASDEDVIFKSVILEHGTRTKKELKEEDALEQTVDRGEVATEDRGSTEEKQIKGQSNEQIYGKVASFLEQFKSLESAKEQLNCLEEDLKLKKETLEAAISKVEAAWKGVQKQEEKMELQLHSREMFECLNKMRKDQSYTDVVLRVKGKSFHAHKVVLAASSRFFDAMFSSEMKEHAQTEVELKEDGLTEEAFELLLNFIYSSILPLNENSVVEILEAADHLEILSVVRKCSLFIINNLSEEKFDLETRLKILRLADRHHLAELHEEILRALALKFGEICEDTAFIQNITADELLLLLSRNDLSVPSETFLFKSVIAWIKFDEENRLSHAARLLDKVRLVLVDIMVVLEELESQEFRKIPECFSFMHTCLLQHVRPFLCSPFAQEKGMPRVSSKALVSLSLTGGTKFFNIESKNWEPLHGLKLPSLQRKPAILFTGNHLFLFDEKDVHQYQIDTSTWTVLPPLKTAHENFQACVCEDFLYVIGGAEANHSVISERFSFSKKMWQFISFHEELGLHGCAVAVHKGCIYSIGGSWADGGAGREVCRFDPAKNVWTKLERTKHSHTHACAFEVNGRLYVAGGKTDPPSKRQRGLIPSRYVEVYDEENDQWHDVPQPRIPPSNYGAIEIENHIFFILGNFAYNSGVKIEESEVYQVDLEEWEPMSHVDDDAVFVYMPVNRDGAPENPSQTEEASNELLSETDKLSND